MLVRHSLNRVDLYFSKFLISSFYSSTSGIFCLYGGALLYPFPSRLCPLWGCVGLDVPALPSSAGLPWETARTYLIQYLLAM